MKVVDAIAHILKVEGAEFLSAYPTTSLIEAAAEVDIRPVLCRQERVQRPEARRLCMQYGPGAENAFPELVEDEDVAGVVGLENLGSAVEAGGAQAAG